ncbi:para-aminobenzoate synthase, (PABA) [Coemansia sp. RSA 2711]|nr:para-aminobenzoate synthase, (PABA) [Coemansia sp. RSA 2711]
MPVGKARWRPRTLVVDNYDSYTYNLVQLLAQADASTHIMVIRNDQYAWSEVRTRILPHIDNIVISPGPGTPTRSEDFGVCTELLEYAAREKIPVLGVCLGHQGIASVFGGRVAQSTVPVHGQCSEVEVLDDACLFRGVPSGFRAVRYHSLVVEDPGPLQVLARARGTVQSAGGAAVPCSAIMAVRHRELPLWGVQFHPESVCSEYGQQMVANFSEMTAKVRRRLGRPIDGAEAVPRAVAALSVLEQDRRTWSGAHAAPRFALVSRRVKVPREDAGRRLFEHLHAADPMPLWLDDSAGAGMSVLASGMDTATVRYHVHTRELRVTRCISNNNDCLEREVYAEVLPRADAAGTAVSFWTWMQRMTSRTQVEKDADAGLPGFRCGWVGYFGYEMGDESVAGIAPRSLAPEGADHCPADAQLTFVDRCVVVDAPNACAYVMALVRESAHDEDEPWVDALGFGSERSARLWVDQRCAAIAAVDFDASLELPALPGAPDLSGLQPTVDRPAYLRAIARAQTLIAQGETYEVCLTNEFHSPTRCDRSTAQHLYMQMRKRSPAPFGAFLWSNYNAGILSCSPERFQRTTTQPGSNSLHVEMKPIKGTCAREPVAQDPGWRERDQGRARGLQESVKERAENLMIVDLVRHDLNAIAVRGSVQVAALMAVESFARVHQLVSTVQAQVAGGGAVAALAHCFPPGSMTGAPKARTLQIIAQLESRRRGVYSGVLGYVSAHGASDWAVVIRTAVATQGGTSVGAGGALTILSDPGAEWAEVLTKVQSIL